MGRISGKWPMALVSAALLLVLAASALAACGDDDDNSAATATGEGGGGATATKSGASATATKAGGGGGGGNVNFDPAKADAIAHAAMLVESDLPGTGWKVTSTDSFSDDDTFGDSNTTSAACKKIDDEVSKVTKDAAAARAGRAEKAFSQQGTLFETSIDVTVNIFKDAKTPDDTLKVFKGAIEGDDFDQCFKDLVEEGAAGQVEGVKIEAKAVDTLASPPNSGAKSAVDVTVDAGLIKTTVHSEFYAWRESNAGITVSISGPKDDLKADVVKAALDKVQAKLKAQAK